MEEAVAMSICTVMVALAVYLIVGVICATAAWVAVRGRKYGYGVFVAGFVVVLWPIALLLFVSTVLAESVTPEEK
jgi:hypothetical protein